MKSKQAQLPESKKTGSAKAAVSASTSSKIPEKKGQTKQPDAKTSTQQVEEASHLCKICFERPWDSALNCGHMICFECGSDIKSRFASCPFCKKEVLEVTKLYLP